MHGVSLIKLLTFQALVSKLCEGIAVNANNAVVTGVLATVGELARVVGLYLSFSVAFFEDSHP